MNQITFNGKTYPLRTLMIWGNECDIASTDLQTALFPDGSKEANKEAGHLDGKIYYYADPESFAKSDRELAEIVFLDTVEENGELFFCIETTEDVAEWFKHLYVAESLNFHPDTPFDDYINDKGQSYDYEQVKYRDHLLNTCFTVCEAASVDIYGIANDVFEELQKNWKVL